ncbi:MAG: hypothetical protein ACI85O_001253, partial [Saprospiraceae bacterium]
SSEKVEFLKSFKSGFNYIKPNSQFSFSALCQQM